MKKIKDFLFAITSPTFWFRNYRSSNKADSILNDIIENKKRGYFRSVPIHSRSGGVRDMGRKLSLLFWANLSKGVGI